MLRSLLNNLKLWWHSRELSKITDDTVSDLVFVPPQELVQELHSSYKLGPATVYLMKPGIEGKEELKQRMMGLSGDVAIKKLELGEKMTDLFMSKLVFAPRRKRSHIRKNKRDPKQRGLNS